jgi:hypothetical protein
MAFRIIGTSLQECERPKRNQILMNQNREQWHKKWEKCKHPNNLDYKICTGSLTEVNTLLRFSSIDIVTETPQREKEELHRSLMSVIFYAFYSLPVLLAKTNGIFYILNNVHLYNECCGWTNFTILTHENYRNASLLRHISSVHSISFHLLSSWRCVSASKANGINTPHSRNA